MRIILLTTALGLLSLLGFACGGGPEAANNTSVIVSNNSNATPPPVSKGGSTPTETYKLLFAAVKSKNTEAIKQLVSTNTQAFAQGLAQQQNKPIEKVYENGFTATTFAESLPEIRDERIDGNMGAIEVRNAKDNKWEDLPFVKDDGGWKLAIGDIFKGTYKSPGKGRDVKEQEAANAAGKGPKMGTLSNSNLNTMPTANAASNRTRPM